MNTIVGFVLALALCLGTVAFGAAMAYNSHHALREYTVDAQMATDGAFRDGYFVGKLTAERGLVPHPPIGRWSNAKDRASFVAGYRRGYGEVPAGGARGD